VVSSNKKYKHRRIVLVVCVVLPIFLYAGYVFGRNLKTYNSLKEQLVDAKEDLVVAKEENEQLKEEVEYTKTDDFIVQKARELLGFVKPGEVKFVENGD
jgi:cell division protein FtsB